MTLFTTRKITGLGFLICFLGMAGALYFQFFKDMAPCPLCVMQRVGLIGAGIVFLIAFIHNSGRKGLVTYGIIGLIFTLFGLGIAIRQVYLQHLPPGSVPACGPGLNYLFETLPLNQFLLTMFKGTGDCAITHVNVLGLSLAGMSGVAFLLLSFFNITLVFVHPKKHRTSEERIDEC